MSTTVTKRDLANHLAATFNQPPALALQMVQAVLDGMVDALARGERIEFRDFGIFEPVQRSARMALNPKTLERVPVPSRVVVRFKPGREMKQRVSRLKSAKPSTAMRHRAAQTAQDS